MITLLALAGSSGAVGGSGALYSWGDNYFFELGDGIEKYTINPTPPSGLPGSVSKVAVYGNGTLTLSGGSWYGWGYGANGELCNGSTSDSLTPVVTSYPVAAELSGGGYHTLILNSGGVLACGNGGSGQLGNGQGGTGSAYTVSSPVSVTGLTTGVVKVDAGENHSLAVMADGTVRSWGDNYGGQLGDGTTGNKNVPVTVSGLSNVVAVSGGFQHSLALKSDGTVMAWGRNGIGELGDGTKVQRETPVPVVGLTNVSAVAASNSWSMALRDDGTVWTWGGNFAGALGTGGDSLVPQQVPGVSGVTAIAAGANHAVALKGDGTVVTWGDNYYRQLGNATSAQPGLPSTISGLTGVLAIGAGSQHSSALRNNGTMVSWGGNRSGSAAATHVDSKATPGVVAAPGDSGIVSVAAGSGHALGLTSAGAVLAWGGNSYGELGDGGTSTSATPLPVAGLGAGVRQVATSLYSASYALKADGSVAAWGSNQNGELGDGTTEWRRLTPVSVTGLGGPATFIAAGGFHGLAVMGDKTVRAWGSNVFGNLGNGTTSTTPNTSAVPVTGLTNVVAVGAGEWSSYAVTSTGALYAWGSNQLGQLGDGTTNSSSTPILVQGLTHVVAVAAGYYNAIALRNDGTVWTWGSSNTGSSPTQVPGLANVAAIATRGGNHSLALKLDGTVLAWGSNGSGQLGNGSTSDAPVPTPVVGLSGPVQAIAAGVSSSYAVVGGSVVTPDPVLFAAVPDATPGTLGVSGVWDSGQLGAGTPFDIEFFSVPACDPSAPRTSLGSRSNLVTNETGVGAFAIDGLTNVPIGTLVTAVVSSGGDTSPISNCPVAEQVNTSWQTAVELASGSLLGLQASPNTAPGASPAASSGTGYLRTTGEARWFKIPILPNSRVDVTLKDLPADYDLLLFRDIEAAYDKLLGGEDYVAEDGPNLALDDLTKQGAETPTDVFNTSQFSSSAWDPTNWDPNLNSNVFSTQFSPTEWSPTEWSSTLWSPTEWSPTEWSPTEWSPTEWSPTEWSPTEWSDSQWSPTEWSTSNPADPRSFSAAQTSSLLAVSGGTGTAPESVSVNTWNNSGFFYARVQGKNGSFDPDAPFTLEVDVEGSVCSGVVDQQSSPTAPAGDRRTVILVDSSRTALGSVTNLSAFAARPEVEGVVVDVNDDSAVRALNAQANAKPGCPYAKNLVASGIKRIVDAYRESNPIDYLVVVGDDSVIPFYRYPDPALLGNETMFSPPVRDNTASQASLRLGYVLSDDFLASTETVSLHGNEFPIPDVAIGRLVETPAEINGMLGAYLAAPRGVVVPGSSLTTGYDFLTDTADEVAAQLQAGIGGTGNDRLITDPDVSPGVVTVGSTTDRRHSWTGADLRRSLLQSGRHDLVFLAGHFSANDALAADYRTNVLSTELPSSTTNFENAIVFSAGCHSGYNIVNGEATPVTESLDWAQAFAQKRATLIAGTGYQYGDTDFMAHSERIYAEFARQLRITTLAGGAREPVAVGRALLRSKQIFLETTPGLSSVDEKSLLEATLFGLPMLSVNMPSGRIPETAEIPVVSPEPVGGDGPGAGLALQVDEISVGATLDPEQKQMTDGPLATWLEGPDGVAVKPTQPILPLESRNVTPPSGLALRGVGFRGGSYTDTVNVTPLTAALAMDLRGIHAPFFTDVLFPTRPWTANYFGALDTDGGSTQLHVTPVQHRSTSLTMTRRTFSDLDLRLYYSGNVESYCPGSSPRQLAPCPDGVAVTPALAAPPTITGVETTYDEDTEELTFGARVVGDPAAGIEAAWVTWTMPPAAGTMGGWQSLDLVQDEDDATLWTGVLEVADPGAVNFVVQAVNGVGHVTIDDNVGAFYRPGAIPGPLPPDAEPPAATALTFTDPPPSSVAYGAGFSVKVRLTSGGSAAEGKVVRIGLDSAEIPATTDSNGEAQLVLRAGLAPGTYPVIASFAGDSTHAASDASRNVAVVRRPTTMTLGGVQGSGIPLVATLQTTSSPATPLHQRTVFVVLQGPATAVFSGATDPQGRLTVPASFLTELPAGSYTARASFNGVTLPGGVVIPPDDPSYGPSSATISHVLWPFTGFIGLSNSPALNSAKAGASVPVKFSLGANRGLAIIASGYPKTGTINCVTRASTGSVEAVQSTGFRYDAKNRHYTYDWKALKPWAGCRRLVFRFTDGTERAVLFNFG